MCCGTRFIVTLFCCSLVNTTTDMNIHQIQYVADHLTMEECRNLAEALHEKTYILLHNITSKAEPNRHCIVLLLHWDRHEGKGKTFNDLSLRLRQIGRSDIANKLSKSVYHEQANNIRKGYLDDPFKKMIPAESALLDESIVRTSITPERDDEVQFTTWEVTCMTSGMFCLLVLIGLSFYKCCPTFIPDAWKKYAPDMWVDCTSIIMEECSMCCSRVKKQYYVQVVGKVEHNDPSYHEIV